MGGCRIEEEWATAKDGVAMAVGWMRGKCVARVWERGGRDLYACASWTAGLSCQSVGRIGPSCFMPGGGDTVR
jgi:hypothetical protein